MRATILAKSSSGEPYSVDFLQDGTSIRVFCHCPAGVLQQMCKHKLALIKGDSSMLFDPSQAQLLSNVHSWPGFDALKTRTVKYEAVLTEIEVAKGALAKREKAVKAEFGRGLSQGFQ